MAGLLLAGMVLAEGEEEELPNFPTGTATLEIGGQPAAAVPFLLPPMGPLFALEPVANALGVDLRIGPYGESHTLYFDGTKINVGPGMPTILRMPTDGGRGDEELVQLRQPPLKGPMGLVVSLDFLEMSFGEHRGIQFTWQPEELRLEVVRRQLEVLEASVDVVNQPLVSTVVIQLPKAPRYRVEDMPGAMEIVLLGDRLAPRPPQSTEDGALVTGVRTFPDRIRLELRDEAKATEPRLQEGSVVRLIIEVFRQQITTTDEPAAEDPFAGRPADSRGGIRTIVLDPGHGGEETGAIGKNGTMEKDLNLVIARALRQALERRLPVDVILTRDGDYDIPHDTRTAIANQNKADLFISLHFNSYFGRSAQGAETFFLSREASDQQAAEAAAFENRSSETDTPEGGGPLDEELDLEMILWDLAQSYHLAGSQRFANLVQEELNDALGLRNRGVKQAPFRVLIGADMPAVLVELGFLSNPKEEEKLQSPLYRSQLVDALVRATSRFKAQIEAREAQFNSGLDEGSR